MRRSPKTTRRWIVPVMVGGALLISVGRVIPAEADDERTFCSKTLDGWIKALRHGSSRERAEAALALSYFGPDARKAVPDLVLLLRDERLARVAVNALGRIGPDAAQAVPHLIERFVKQGCLHYTGMGSIGFNPGARDVLVRIGAAAVPALLDVLNGPDRDMRVCAAEALGGIGPAARAAVPSLLRELHAEQPELDDAKAEALRHQAVIALGRVGPDAKAAVPALNTLLDRELADKETVYPEEWPIVEALDRIGALPVAKLVDGFLREEGSWRSFELAKLGPRARAAIPALRQALTHPQLRVRIDAAIALTSIDPPAPDAVRVLVAALDPHQEDAWKVPEALGRLGPEAVAALPVLIGLLNKGPAREDVIEALVRIDPGGAVCVPLLIKALGDTDSDIVDAAARALGLLGPRARPAVPVLAATLDRKITGPFQNEGDPIADVARALGRIGPEARSAIPALIRALKSPPVMPAGFDREEDEIDQEGAAACARVLGGFGPDAKAAVPTLIGVLRARDKDDEDWEVRREAALALGRIGPDATAAVPVLRKVVDEGPPPTSGGMRGGLPPQVSDAAVVALFHLAPDGKGIAETWADRSRSPIRRAFVLGAMGRPSFEADAITGTWLEQLDRALSDAADEGNEPLFIEGYIDRLGDLGVGGRSAVPRLNELRRHRNPWVRQWAGEVLGRITRADRSPERASGTTNQPPD